LTTPAITNPTGLDSNDVGLANVDNTSDVTKNAASVTLTNKTLTSPVISAIVSVSDGDISILPNGSGEVVLDTSTKVSATGLYVGASQDASAAIDVVSTTQGIGLPSMTTTQRDAISTPKTGLQIYNSSTSKANVYDGSSWQEMGGGAGEINFITNGNAEAGTTGWATYDDGAVAAPVDGTGGSPSTITLTAQATTVLRGDNSFKLAKSAADGQGEGISYDFTIDAADKNKLLKISFDYNTDLTYTNEDLKVYIYDITNTTLITPADNGLIGKDKDDDASGARTISWASTDSTSYRLIFHQTTTNASTADLYLDNVIVGPGSTAVGAAVTAWKSETLSFTNFTVTSQQSRSRRVGSNMEIETRIVVDGAPTGNMRFVIPDSLTIDTAIIGVTGDKVVVQGYALASDNATVFHAGSPTVFSDGDEIQIISGTGSNTNWNATVPMTWASGDELMISVSIPIAEWSGSGTVNLMSDNAATANASSMWKVTNTSYTSGTTMDFDAVNSNYTNVGSWANTNGSITIPSDGRYTVNTNVSITGTFTVNQVLTIQIGGANRGQFRTGTGTKSVDGTVTLDLSKGDLLTVELNGSVTLDGDEFSTFLNITRQQDYSAGQPVGFGIATAENHGLVKKSKYQIELLSSGHTMTGSAGTHIGNLSMTNLTIGATYRVTVRLNMDDNGDNANTQVNVTDAASTVIMAGAGFLFTDSGSGRIIVQQESSIIFVAASTSLQCVEAAGTGAVIGAANRSSMMLEELNNIELTTEW
jgi:hypothetical protein